MPKTTGDAWIAFSGTNIRLIVAKEVGEVKHLRQKLRQSVHRPVER